ncbi:MAG: hypothetical protein ACYCXU_00525 [Thermoleophilia bacterium]
MNFAGPGLTETGGDDRSCQNQALRLKPAPWRRPAPRTRRTLLYIALAREEIRKIN